MCSSDLYVVTPFRSSRLADLITQKLGIPDHIVEPASLRTMHFKAALQLKAIDNFRRQRELKRLSEEKIVIKEKSPENKGPDPADNQIKIKGMPALQLEEDLFLYRNSRFESQSKRFLIELEGPDPRTGEWLPYQEKNIVGSSWRWVPAESGEQKHEQSCGSDGWVHQGEKPEFHENTGMWVLISEKPSLRFQKRDRVLAHKIRMGALNELGELFIAENSPAAEENLQGIRHKAQSARKGERKTERADLEIEQQRDPNQL